MLIRDDCNGDIYAVDKNFLSFHYRYALKNAGLEKHASEEYVKALDRNKAWSDMCEFPTYRSVEGAVLARLIEMQLPPNLIKAMKVNDFRDFVRNNCGEEFARYRERKSFIKTFINARETEFREMLNRGGKPGMSWFWTRTARESKGRNLTVIIPSPSIRRTMWPV